MKRITRDVPPNAVHDLFERVPRATIAFSDAAQLEAVPVAFRFEDGCHCIGVTRGGTLKLPPHAQVTLVIDEGWYWFDLRAIRIRGTALPAERPPKGGSPALEWFQVVGARVTAWDYATLHEEEHSAAR